MKNPLSALLIALLVLTGTIRAHFVFVTPNQSGASAQVFMSENLLPDLDAAMIRSTKLSIRTAAGSPEPLTLSANDKTFLTAALPGAGDRVIFGTTEFGVMSRGQGKPHLLVYYPKALVGNAFNAKLSLGDAVPVEIVPKGSAGAVTLLLLARGKPQPSAEITVILPNGTEKKVKTGANGETEALTDTGRLGAWARYWETTPGEHDGKKYEELRHYATLVFDTSATEKAAAVAPVGTIYTKLPQATASFGAVESDGWLYVYGGHVSPTHTYFKEAVSGLFNRVNLSGAPNWETLPAGPGLQGMNLAAYKGKIYRVGGMAPQNERGKPADNLSIAGAARFDTAKKQWEDLPPLPEPRSSHDVVVIDGKLIVTGGWAMAGKSEEWRNTLAILDLNSPTSAWTTQPQPFQRRALMAVALDGKMYVIGGMNDKQQVVRSVSIYDPKTNQWSEGPELPAGTNLGFAPAAGAHAGRLYVSVADGTLLCLNPATGAWEKTAASSPRVAHRLAFTKGSVLLVGGAAKGQNLDLVEALSVQN